MATESIFKYSLLTAVLIYYFIYSLKYSIIFKKNSFYIGRRKVFHYIMIWLFPFVWISILKSILKPTPGSYSYHDKKNPEKMEDNTTDWVVWAAASPPNSGNN